MTKHIPTNTFHPRRGLGPGLNLLIITPDNRNPNTIPNNDTGPIESNEKKNTYVFYRIIIMCILRQNKLVTLVSKFCIQN